MKLSRNQSQSEPVWARFKEARPQIKVTCSDDESVGCNTLSGKSVAKDLWQLSQLVGNPATKESVWMNACIGAGGKSLAPQHTLHSKIWLVFKTSAGAVFAMLTLLLNYSLSMFVAAQSAWFFRGVDVDNFLRSLTGGDGMGLLIALLAGLCFWVSLLVEHGPTRMFVSSGSTLLVALALVFGGTTLIGIVGGVVLSLLCIALLLGIAHVGRLCRESLPANFNAAKLAQSGIGMLMLPAFFMAWVLQVAMADGTQHSSSYANGTESSLGIFLGVFAFCLIGQGFAMARASKSTSRAACAFLAVCVQTPLLFGLSIATLVAAGAAAGSNIDSAFPGLQMMFSDSQISSAWKILGADKASFLLLTTMITLTLAAIGGYLGAITNSTRSLNGTTKSHI
jgi:hypothetical protein